MGKSDPFPKKYKNPSAKTKDKYSTEYHNREKREKNREGYRTAPNDTKQKSSKEPLQPAHQFDYLKNNLHIKSCVCGNREVTLKFQAKKISFRNYTPKILNQEVNMGMWM